MLGVRIKLSSCFTTDSNWGVAALRVIVKMPVGMCPQWGVVHAVTQ